MTDLNLSIYIKPPPGADLRQSSGKGPDEAIPWFDGALDEEEDGIEATVAPPRPLTPKASRPPPIMASSARLRDEGEIARGGMGSIRRLYDAELRRHIAMKVIDPELGNDPGMAQRFIDEARITGLLDHANIVPVHELAIEDRSHAAYTMKLVDGKTLTALIAMQRNQRDLERILQSLISVCDALALAHSRGVIHRDLKPDNIMVGDFGQVYLMDWGCAQVTGDRSFVEGAIEPDGMVIGTLQYMAPEQALGQISKIDPRTDVFGLGAILYKALTGAAPYPGPLAEALPRAQRGDVRPPDEATGVAIKPPPLLSQIAMKAMAREPADRYQSAAEFADALRAFLRGGNWFPLHKFPVGAVIVREGDVADAAYIITAGRCEVRKRDPNDPTRYITLRVLQAGDVFGETAIFADTPRSASVVVLDEVSAVVVERAALEHLVESSYLGQFVKALADRFLDVDARLQRP
ncbi:MAG: cyclic nucleotide-binding domain-containing protein [Proteobacteria bacterium]|nr:cyclic nucleotide-binding domain-containing protein [Pseudomonadota bacterium]